MKVIASSLSFRNRWLRQPVLSHAYRAWLTDGGSLTKKLQQKSRQFSVIPVCQSRAKAYIIESGLLHLKPYQYAWIRDVTLLADNQVRVFAHSVIPPSAMRGPWHRLGQLGSRSLGATLFVNPKVSRTPLRYQKLNSRHALYQAAIAQAGHAKMANLPASLWARRSIFCLGHASIIVTEVFLPAVLTL